MGYASALILGRSQECGLYRNDHFIEKEKSSGPADRCKSADCDGRW